MVVEEGVGGHERERERVRGWRGGGERESNCGER